MINILFLIEFIFLFNLENVCSSRFMLDVSKKLEFSFCLKLLIEFGRFYFRTVDNYMNYRLREIVDSK